MTEFDIVMAIAKKLGWTDMLVSIAVPAIKEIIYIADVPPSKISDLDADRIFAYLAGLDAKQSDITSLIMVRGEIEDYMRRGVNHTNAINEWWK